MTTASIMSLKDFNRGYRHPFLFGIHFLGGVGDIPRTLVELAMCQFSAELRRSPDWWKRFQNQDVREEWSQKAQRRIWKVRTPSAYVDIMLFPQQIDYVLDELAGYAILRDPDNKCEISCFERIWESEQLLDEAHNNKIDKELSILRNQVPSPNRNNDGVTISLIDPFLHCLVYNRTLVSHPHSRHPRPLPSPPGDIYTVSQHFAFLPSDVSISSSGLATFKSYINNLSPDHISLYAQLEGVLTALLPLFEHTLTDLHRNNPLNQRITGPCRYTIWEEPDEPEFSDDEEGWATYERDLRYWVMNRPLHLPDVPEAGYIGGLEHRKHVVKLRGRNLQVVIDISEIRLQPGGPEYSGSSWHVEGMRNERIVACGLFYHSVENITESSIEFRMAVTSPRGFTAGDTGATLRTWGLQDGDSCHQYIGSRPIHARLGLVFPNIYQHRQTSFRLADPAREGHQTVISVLLIDPEIHPIVSTAMVAPQQKAWIRSVMDMYVNKKVPVEILEKIMDDVESVMEMEEAEQYKKELLEVRTRFWEANNNYHFCIPFDIWGAPDFPH